jgi:hypothetical protein
MSWAGWFRKLSSVFVLRGQEAGTSLSGIQRSFIGLEGM